MPSVKNAQRRYRIIDSLIRNKYKSYPSKDELRRACEVDLYGINSEGDISVSTIEKDIKFMKDEFDAPIKYDRNQGGYYYDDEEFSLEKIPLNEEELKALRFAAASLMSYRDFGIFKQFDLAIGKIFEEVNVKDSHEENQKIWFDRKDKKVRGQEFLQPILDAMDNELGLKMRYASQASQKVKDYTLKPHILKEFDSLWYLIAENVDRKIIQTFELGRVQSVETHVFPTGQSFVPFDAKAYFNFAYGITVPREAEAHDIQLKFTGIGAKLVEQNPLHESQKTEKVSDQESLVSFKVFITPELKAKILSYGSNVKVLNPSDLVDWHQDEIFEMQKNY